MKLYCSILFGILFMLVPIHFLLAQPAPANKKASNAYKKAELSLNNRNIKEAINQLHIAIESDPSFAKAIQQLADLYRVDKNFKQAIPLYEKVIQINPNLTSLSYFGLGESLLAEGRYKEALPYLTEYARGKLTEKGALLTSKYIEDCKYALKNEINPLIIIEKLPSTINTKDNEYFPKFAADSRRIIFTRKTNDQENFYESIFRDDKWSPAQKLTENINTTDFNEGAHSISPDGKYLYFTGCNRPDGLGSCDIYVSQLTNGDWGIPRNLGAPINSNNWESQPSISADGRFLYFTSNRPGGFGGYDIWKSELLENGIWSTAINLGDKINTAFDEGSPFIHADNKTLYFASNGWPGYGQQDLFMSKIDSMNNWSTPINLGSPINNHYHQNSIQITMDGDSGYISSQDSSRQLDIYKFAVPKSIKPNPIAYIIGNIYDKDTKNNISATIAITNTASKEIVYKEKSNYIDGSFLATLPIGYNYALHIQKEGYLFYSEQYDLSPSQIKDKEFIREIFLDPIKSGSYIKLNNLYFDSNKYNLLPESFTELHVLIDFLNLHPNLNIEIAGHTDNTGAVNHNILLSENRSKAVFTYLVEHKISPKRITTIGYGDKQPIADNNDGAGRKLNRRTEIKIIK